MYRRDVTRSFRAEVKFLKKLKYKIQKRYFQEIKHN